MKLLNIDYQIGRYSIEVNNCIEYNIAGFERSNGHKNLKSRIKVA